MTYDINEVRAQIKETCDLTIKTCTLIETRMVDAWVMALPTGEVLTTEGNIGIMPTEFGTKVERHRDKPTMAARLDDVKRQNQKNGTVQQLRLMSFKKAARLQRVSAEEMLDKLPSE